MTDADPGLTLEELIHEMQKVFHDNEVGDAQCTMTSFMYKCIKSCGDPGLLQNGSWFASKSFQHMM